MKRNKFSLSHTTLLTCDMGELIPVSLIEVLPGDTVQMASNVLLRCSPLLAPVYHPVHVRLHCWYVPHRLVWGGSWENFITGGPDGMDAAVFPTISLTNVATGSLADYLGVPTGFTGEVSALPFRGYRLIYNEWYRDQDLVPVVPIGTGSGPDTITPTDVVNVAWEKDYFTSSRPWEQKGPTVTIPIQGTADVVGLGGSPTFQVGGHASTALGMTAGSANIQAIAGPAGSGTAALWADPALTVDLASATGVTVTALREALALQRYEEARARYGSRYVEYLRYLGVRSSDARLQRPEYVGGGRQTIQFSEVLQTGPGASPDSNVGNLKGHGIAAMRSHRYRRFFEEHGYVFCLLSVLPKTMYMQGLFRHWNRRQKDEFWQKEFEAIGQQAVTNKEVYALHSSPDGTFGFQDRYDEYRRMESRVSGDFRTTLNFWHLAREFSSEPALNASFVTSVPTERVFAAPSADVLWIYARHSIQARRMVAKTGVSYIY